MPQASQSTSATTTSKVNELSEADVIRLLNPEQGMQARLDVTEKLANQYGSMVMTQEESIIAEQVFRLLVRDTELEIRKRLSSKLKSSRHVPRDIALTMATDVTEVALPILEHSKVLTDIDLADLIEATPDTQRHIAIAKRENVSESVVEALLQATDEVGVATTLANNAGAQLNPLAVETLVNRHKRLPQVMDMLATRPNLPATVREKVIAYVSESIKGELSSQHDEAKDIVTKEANQSREQVTLELINNDLDEAEMQKLVEQLIAFERLTPSLLLAAIVRGYISFYVVTMSVMAKVPIENTLKLMRDRGGLGFRALYNKSDLPPEHFSVLREITPMAIALKDEMSGLEGAAFAKVLTKRMVEQGKILEKSSDHIVTAIKEAMA